MLVRRFALLTVAGACLIAGSPATTLAQTAPPPTKVESVGDVKAMLTPALPAGAKEISEVVGGVGAAKVGDTVTLHGWIPDGPGAFSESAAEFTLTQPPAPPAVGAAPSARVRIASPSGETVKGSLSGKHALKAGAEVFVTGVVEVVEAGRVTVKAASMHVPRSALPGELFTTPASEAPGGAVDVSEARKTKLKVGDEVVLRGRIGGSKAPFVGERALFTLMGRGLKACSENPGQTCISPWDYCCETREEILAHSVTVQVADAKGQPLRTEMKGRRGLKELSEVVVVGKVTAADGKSVVVSATRMHVVAQ